MKRMLIQFYFKYVVLNVSTSVERFHSTIQPALNRSEVKHTFIGEKNGRNVMPLKHNSVTKSKKKKKRNPLPLCSLTNILTSVFFLYKQDYMNY